MEQELYELPEGWEWKRLDEILVFRTGFAFKASQYVDKGLLVFRATNITKSGEIDISNARYVPTEYMDEYEKYSLSEGDIIVVMVGATTGKMGVVTSEAVPSLLNQNQWKLDIKDDYFFPLYCFYCLKSFMPTFLESMQGAAREFIKQKDFKKLKLPVPPLNEQKRIVARLDALFTRIDAAITHLQETLELSKALFASALENSMSGVLDEYGEKKVGDFAEKLQTGKTPPTRESKYYENPELNWFAPSDFGSHKLVTDSKKKIAQRAVEDGKANTFEPGTIMLVAIGATIGKVGLLDSVGSSNQQVTGIRFGSAVNPEYAYYWFVFIKQTIIDRASKATLPIINQKGIKTLPFSCPSIDEQQRIVIHLDALAEHTRTLEAETQERLDQLAALKSSLLDSAFRGEL